MFLLLLLSNQNYKPSCIGTLGFLITTFSSLLLHPFSPVKFNLG